MALDFFGKNYGKILENREVGKTKQKGGDLESGSKFLRIWPSHVEEAI